MKLNHLADWYDEEYDDILGLEHDEPEEEGHIPIYPQKELVEPINWYDKQLVTRVRDRTKWISNLNQAKLYCASSYAVVTAEMLEAKYAKRTGKVVPFSV